METLNKEQKRLLLSVLLQGYNYETISGIKKLFRLGYYLSDEPITPAEAKRRLQELESKDGTAEENWEKIPDEYKNTPRRSWWTCNHKYYEMVFDRRREVYHLTLAQKQLFIDILKRGVFDDLCKQQLNSFIDQTGRPLTPEEEAIANRYKDVQYQIAKFARAKD